jgi:hypothetical protein
VTGSTRFGSLLANTHQFTGSVGISGSLSGSSAAFSTSISTSNLLTISYADISTGDNRGLRIVNTDAGEGAAYNITSGRTGQNNGDFVIRNTTTGVNNLVFNRSTGAATFSSSVTMGGDLILTPTDSAISFSSGAARFFTGGQEKMRITSGNDIGIGAITITNPNSIGRVLELKLASSVGIVLNDSRDASPIGLENRGAVFYLTYGTSNLLVADGASGRIGIGTSTPVTTFQVRNNSWQQYISKSFTSQTNVLSINLKNNGSAIINVTTSAYRPGVDTYAQTITYLLVCRGESISVGTSNSAGQGILAYSTSGSTFTLAFGYAGSLTNFQNAYVTIQGVSQNNAEEAIVITLL